MQAYRAIQCHQIMQSRVGLQTGRTSSSAPQQVTLAGYKQRGTDNTRQQQVKKGVVLAGVEGTAKREKAEAESGRQAGRAPLTLEIRASTTKGGSRPRVSATHAGHFLLPRPR